MAKLVRAAAPTEWLYFQLSARARFLAFIILLATGTSEGRNFLTCIKNLHRVVCRESELLYMQYYAASVINSC